MALDQRFKQGAMSLDQQKMQVTSQLQQTALAMTAQAEQARLQREMAEKMGMGAFAYPQPAFGYPAMAAYAQAPMHVAKQ